MTDYTVPPPEILQISASPDCLYALCRGGRVYTYHPLDGWRLLPKLPPLAAMGLEGRE
jgi:hypothetical protein